MTLSEQLIWGLLEEVANAKDAAVPSSVAEGLRGKVEANDISGKLSGRGEPCKLKMSALERAKDSSNLGLLGCHGSLLEEVSVKGGGFLESTVSIASKLGLDRRGPSGATSSRGHPIALLIGC